MTTQCQLRLFRFWQPNIAQLNVIVFFIMIHNATMAFIFIRIIMIMFLAVLVLLKLPKVD